MINSIVVSALSGLGVPVAFQRYTGEATTYLTFFTYNEQGELHADDNEVITGYYVQVDLWSKSDYAALADLAQAALENIGFIRTISQDLYEWDTQIFHKAMRFFKTVEN